MASDILVPTDGSALADGALAYAEILARVRGGTRLRAQSVRVTPRAGEREAEAANRLDAVCARLRARGVPAEARVAIIAPIALLQDGAKDKSASLAIQATDGRSGPARWVLGGAAVRVEAGASRQVIERAAMEHDIGWIARASHGQGGLGGLALGSTALAALRNTRVPVLVASGAPNV